MVGGGACALMGGAANSSPITDANPKTSILFPILFMFFSSSLWLKESVTPGPACQGRTRTQRQRDSGGLPIYHLACRQHPPKITPVSQLLKRAFVRHPYLSGRNCPVTAV